MGRETAGKNSKKEKVIHSDCTDGGMIFCTDCLEFLPVEVEAHGRAPSGCLVLSHLFTLGGVEQQHQSRSEADDRDEGLFFGFNCVLSQMTEMRVFFVFWFQLRSEEE